MNQWTDEDTETLEALQAVVRAYKSYGTIARRDSLEYTSLTLARRAIRKLMARAAGDTR